jgi:hypothetical protein
MQALTEPGLKWQEPLPDAKTGVRPDLAEEIDQQPGHHGIRFTVGETSERAYVKSNPNAQLTR